VATVCSSPGSFFDPLNLWVLCSGCNASKRDLTVEEWEAAVERRGRSKPKTREAGIFIFGGKRR
jgi:hypothetical protein